MLVYHKFHYLDVPDFSTIKMRVEKLTNERDELKLEVKQMNDELNKRQAFVEDLTRTLKDLEKTSYGYTVIKKSGMFLKQKIQNWTNIISSNTV